MAAPVIQVTGTQGTVVTGAKPSNRQAIQIRYRPSLPWEGYETVGIPTEFGTIPDFIFKSMNRRFLDYYELLLSLIPSFDIDEFDAAGIFHEVNYYEASQLFSAYRAYAPFCRSNLTNAVLMWRAQQLNKKAEWADYAKNAHTKVQNKDAWWALEEKRIMLVNYLWAKITWLILQDYDDGEILEIQISVRILDACFGSLTGQTSKLKCFDTNYSTYVDFVSEILSLLTRTLPIPSIERSIMEIDKFDANKNTQEVLYFLDGIKGFHFDICEPKQAPDVMKLLSKLAVYTDTKQKKIAENVRAGALECLANLIGTIASNEPGPDLPPNWITLIEEIHGRLTYLIKKGKLLHLVLPLQSVVLSCCSREVFVEHYNGFLDTVCKYVKPGDKLRVVALDSLYRILSASFSWLSKEEDILDRMARRVARELTQGTSKGKPLAPQEDAVELAVDIVTLIAVKKLDFATNEIVLQMLKFSDRDFRSSDLNTERLMIGFLSIKSMFTRLGISSSLFANIYTRSLPQLKSTLPRKFRQRTLSQWKKREEGFLSPDTLLFGCGSGMDHLFPLLDNQFGNLLLINQTKSIQDLVPSARFPQLDLLDIAVSCLSFALPVKMDSSTLMAILCKYTLHLHEPIRNHAVSVLQELVRTRIYLRAAIVNQFALFIQTITDQNLEYVVSSLVLLNSIMFQWYRLACSEVTELYQRTDRDPLIDVCVLEATFLISFCRPETEVRTVAYEGLCMLNKLLHTVPSFSGAAPTNNVLDVLVQNAEKIVESGRYVPESFPYDAELFEDLKPTQAATVAEISFQSVEMSKPLQGPAKTMSILPTTNRNLSTFIRSSPSNTGLSNGPESNLASCHSSSLVRQNSDIFFSGPHSPSSQQQGGNWEERVSTVFESVLQGKEGASEVDRWACTLGELFRILAIECVDSCSILHRLVITRMDAAYETLLEVERDKNADETFAFMVWRNYLITAIATCGCAGAIVVSQVSFFIVPER
jgi:hypothetical protein